MRILVLGPATSALFYADCIFNELGGSFHACEPVGFLLLVLGTPALLVTTLLLDACLRLSQRTLGRPRSINEPHVLLVLGSLYVLLLAALP